MEKGWIKLHRELFEKPIWTEATPEQKVLLVTLLSMVNHRERQWEWKGEVFTARPGQVITSLPSLAEKCGKNSSIQKIRTALKRFEKYGFLTDKSTAHNRLITIVNWGVYQSPNTSAPAGLTDDQQAANRQLTANKNDKNEKKERRSNRRKHDYDDSSVFYQLALSLFGQMKMNHPGVKEPNFQKWANEFRVMVERDEREAERIEDLINWSQGHSFWHTVILSPAAIRRNWDQLVAQAKQECGSVERFSPVMPKPLQLDYSKGEDMGERYLYMTSY